MCRFGGGGCRATTRTRNKKIRKYAIYDGSLGSYNEKEGVKSFELQVTARESDRNTRSYEYLKSE